MGSLLKAYHTVPISPTATQQRRSVATDALVTPPNQKLTEFALQRARASLAGLLNTSRVVIAAGRFKVKHGLLPWPGRRGWTMDHDV